jgi:hypothetical protein
MSAPAWPYPPLLRHSAARSQPYLVRSAHGLIPLGGVQGETVDAEAERRRRARERQREIMEKFAAQQRAFSSSAGAAMAASLYGHRSRFEG